MTNSLVRKMNDVWQFWHHILGIYFDAMNKGINLLSYKKFSIVMASNGLATGQISGESTVMP